MMLRFLSALALAFLLTSAGDPVRAGDGASLYQRVLAQVGQERLARWLKAPEWTVQEIATLSHGYSTEQALTVDAVEASIAHGWAKARTRAMRDLLDADLDANGAVTRAEIGQISLALSGRARGLIWLRHRRADLDGNGTVDAAELAEYAQGRALSHFDGAAAQARRDLLALDLDGDGAVSPAEAERALLALAKALPAARATLQAQAL